MKTQNLQNSLLAIAVVTTLVFTARNVIAQDSTAASTPPAAASPPAPQLSYGVPDVLKLSQAKIGDSIIVSYVQNSGTIYALNAGEIVYLKQQGVSDNVLNAMLNQRSRLTGSTEPATTTATTASSTTAITPTVTYVQQSVPSSTIYIIPDTQTYEYDAWYYSQRPYYDYYGYYGAYPAVSFSFGYGNRWDGYYGVGYHGGGYHGGGYHGGGFGGGHHH